MLHEFLSANRADLILRCHVKVARRVAPKAGAANLDHGIPRFLDQLIKTLQLEQSSEPLRGLRISGPSGGGPAASEIAVTAALHGRELSESGFTVDQVVHDYGDLCQAITDLAAEREVTIEIDEFRTLNRCLDNGIADAVTAISEATGPPPEGPEIFRLCIGSEVCSTRRVLMSWSRKLGIPWSRNRASAAGPPRAATLCRQRLIKSVLWVVRNSCSTTSGYSYYWSRLRAVPYT